MARASTKASTRDKTVSDLHESSHPLTPEVAQPAPAANSDDSIEKHVTVNRVERFVERAPTRRVETEDDDDLEIVDLDEDEDDEEPLTPFDIVLQQVGDDNEGWLRVDRLPNYAEDGRSDPAAARKFCMNIRPVTVGYLEQISRSFGGGNYLITAYKHGKGFIRRWVEEIAQPVTSPEPSVGAVAALAAVAPQPAAPTVDPLRSKLEQLMLKRLDQAMDQAMAPPAGAPAQLPATAANPPQTDPFDKFVEYFDKFSRVQERIGPQPARTGTLDKIVNVVESLASVAPKVIPLVQQQIAIRAQVAHKQQQQQSAHVVNPHAAAQTPPGSSPTPPQQPVATAEPQPPSPLDNLMNVVSTLVQDLKLNRRTGRTADLIEEQYRKSPEIREQLLALVHDTPANVLLAIAGATGEDLTQFAHSEEWIGDLQDDLRETFVVEAAADGGQAHEQQPSA